MNGVYSEKSDSDKNVRILRPWNRVLLEEVRVI
jgi:hypothetical protein